MDYNSDFLGRGFSFPPRVDPVTGRFAMCEGDEDIRQAVYIIVMTRKNERAMLPDFGCNLHDHVFDLPDPSAISLMREEVIDALVQWEPRIIEINVDIDIGDIPNGRVVINISYMVRDTNNPGNIVFPYYVYEGVGLE